LRCEICNRSMTEVFLDGQGNEHEYCGHCVEEIQEALDSYDEEEESDDWWLVDFERLDDNSFEEYQILNEEDPD